MLDKNCLSYWFPKLEAAGLPVPRTTIIKTDVELSSLLEGERPDGWLGFLGELEAAVTAMGLPCFLRTGQGSGKHNWERTCFVTDAARLGAHVAALVEWSHLVDFMGLPHDVWCVRELLPTVKQFTAFRGMPICREFRFFVRDGDVVCSHPYWTSDSLEEGFDLDLDWDGDCLTETPRRRLPPDWDHMYRCLCNMPGIDTKPLHDLAACAGRAVGGSWSVDIIETTRGWYITDLAEAERSFHWPGCPHAKMLALNTI